ncbi:hypothetical protein EV127DRAFT_143889 [Xylaria flabelliformis]|nr:hypothetical protein EV127DRAFT_143889 [Xylaria flabelliformis]
MTCFSRSSIAAIALILNQTVIRCLKVRYVPYPTGCFPDNMNYSLSCSVLGHGDLVPCDYSPIPAETMSIHERVIIGLYALSGDNSLVVICCFCFVTSLGAFPSSPA